MALIEVVDQIYQYLDRREYVVGVYLDLQKAFDTVNHQILLAKLFNCGIRGNTYNWFCSYLNCRKQFTVVDKAWSDTKYIAYGVHQGSVLGPLLFLLYLNDAKNAAPPNTIKLFADDTNIFVSRATVTEAAVKQRVSWIV